MLDLLESKAPFRVAPAVPLREPERDLLAAARTCADQLRRGASEGDAEGQIASSSLDALHRSGLLLALFPRACGGQGLLESPQAGLLAGILRLVGGGDLSVARLFEGHINAVALVDRYGTEQHLLRLAAAARGGELSGVWNAEGNHPLLAHAEGGLLRLSGEKILASGAGVVSHPVVTPRLPEGVVMVVIERIEARRVNLSAWTPLGMRASATGTVDFSGMTVPKTAQIGEPGDYLRQPFFSGGSWRFCAVHLGAAEHLLDLFRNQLLRRDRDADPYQKQRVATASAACITARLWVTRAAELLAAGQDGSESVVAFANLTRMVTERACLDVLEAVQRGTGLGAFMQPDPIERIARDLATYLRQPVPDAAMADAARFVLASDTPTFDLWRY